MHPSARPSLESTLQHSGVWFQVGLRLGQSDGHDTAVCDGLRFTAPHSVAGPTQSDEDRLRSAWGEPQLHAHAVFCSDRVRSFSGLLLEFLRLVELPLGAIHCAERLGVYLSTHKV